MFFYADLHIHSKYSRATSKSCNLEELALWASKKGLSVISTGDFTHPAWFDEIKEKLVEEAEGTYRLKPEIEKEIFKNNACAKYNAPVKFILSVEISTIYKKGNKTRKVHHVVFMPNLESAQNFRQKLSAIGNITSDGRPILGLDSRNLLEIALESGEGSYIIPAHIWTPWFSVLGSKSGFDSIEECYGDLAEHIFAVETGLSSDPQMNWRVSKLDKFRLVSNSDAHSPSKLAREATMFECEADYHGILKSLKNGNGYVGTVEFFPEEGKYHEDGHRKCNICLSPQETKKLNGICPVCHKPLTIGVSYRVNELADRDEKNITIPETAGKVLSLVPLQEILSEIMQVGASSKSVANEYERLIQKLGSELSILTNIPTDEIHKEHPVLAEGIARLRKGKVIKKPGYDGEYGIIKLFDESEKSFLVKKNFINLKLDLPKIPVLPALKHETSDNNTGIQPHKHLKDENNRQIKGTTKDRQLDEHQQAAVANVCKKLLIVAGPGSGKTTVLTRRIAHMISNKDVKPENCLAITFTRRACEEMRERLNKLLSEKSQLINIHTFHSLCFSILKENSEKAGLEKNFKVISPNEKNLYQNGTLFDNVLEFDDLINLSVKLFESDSQIQKKYCEQFKYIFVDEYQDIDENQYKLIKLLTPPEGNICAIGDPNQAIYGFRGGDSKFFKSFGSDYKDVCIINLKNNYRSAENIVDASNQMIDSNNIVSQCAKPYEKITIHTAQTDNAEAEFVISTIEKLIGGHSFFSLDSQRSQGDESNFSFSDFAILYRTSSQLDALVKALERSGMPYVKLSDDLLCDKKPVRKLLSLLDKEHFVYEQLKNLRCNFREEIDDYIFEYLLKTALIHNVRDDFIHEAALLRYSDAFDKRADRISLMTLHSSKGLEFECVFITGLEDGIIPLYRAKTLEEKEEEKRLLYVGMTRARQRLFLCRALKRKWLGTFKNLPQSPFLEKIENDLLNLSKYKREIKEKDNLTQLSLF